MKKYSFVTDTIEVRSSVIEGKPQLHVSGYAIIPNKKDLYRSVTNSLGKVKSFKSIFTDNAIASMGNQMKHKRIFVDAGHETAAFINVRNMVKDKVDKDTLNKIKESFDLIDFPIAKLADMRIDEKGLYVDTIVNDNLKLVNPNYYDFLKNSLEEGYYNGISVNFAPTKVYEDFIDGDWVDVIDDVDLFGISYVDSPALPDNNIVEVAVRAAMEFRGESMTDEKIERKEKIYSEADVKKMLQDKEEQIKVEKDKEEQKKKVDDLEKKFDELSKKSIPEQIKDDLESGKQPDAKGLVQKRDKPNMPDTTDMDRFRNNLKEIKRGHTDFVESERKGFKPQGALLDGFGQLVDLQLEFNTLQSEPKETLRHLNPKADIIAKYDEKLNL